MAMHDLNSRVIHMKYCMPPGSLFAGLTPSVSVHFVRGEEGVTREDSTTYSG